MAILTNRASLRPLCPLCPRCARCLASPRLASPRLTSPLAHPTPLTPLTAMVSLTMAHRTPPHAPHSHGKSYDGAPSEKTMHEP
eukprot:scaffold24498_cov34-Phaeocystis_antarctica.AAC.1